MVIQIDEQRKTYEEERKGNLAFMLFWQSLDGRPQFVDYSNYEDALIKAAWLKSFKLKPQLYRRMKISNRLFKKVIESYNKNNHKKK